MAGRASLTIPTAEAPPSPSSTPRAPPPNSSMVCFVLLRRISVISKLEPPIWLALAEASGQRQAWRGRYRRRVGFDLFHPLVCRHTTGPSRKTTSEQ